MTHRNACPNLTEPSPAEEEWVKNHPTHCGVPWLRSHGKILCAKCLVSVPRAFMDAICPDVDEEWHAPRVFPGVPFVSTTKKG